MTNSVCLRRMPEDSAPAHVARVRHFARVSLDRLDQVLTGPVPDSSFARGRAGGLLCWSGLHHYLRGQHVDRNWLEEQLEQLLIAAAGMPHGLFSGIEGVLFAAQELGRVHDLDFVADAMPEFDELLADALRSDPDGQQAFDLIEGGAGLVVYACYRAAHGADATNVGLAVDRLARSARRSEGQAHWPSHPAWLRSSPLGIEYPKGCVEIGVAHGQAGVVGALALAISSGCDQRESTRQLLAESLDFVRQQERCHQLTLFSVVAGATTDSRCAWCNGDLGLLGPLRLAARALHDESISALAQRIVQRVSVRPSDSLGFDDAWLCHGFGGAAWVLRRAGKRSRAVELEMYGRAGQGLDALCQAMEAGQDLPWSLLHGHGGLALALTEADGFNCPLDWALPFLL